MLVNTNCRLVRLSFTWPRDKLWHTRLPGRPPDVEPAEETEEEEEVVRTTGPTQPHLFYP